MLLYQIRWSHTIKQMQGRCDCSVDILNVFNIIKTIVF